MSFDQDLARFAAKTETNFDKVYAGVVAETFRSIVEGSELTGAPGQPIDKGTLHDSWTLDRVGPETIIASEDRAAEAVEENWGNVVFHNHGPHSVKLTVASFGRIVDSVALEVSGR